MTQRRQAEEAEALRALNARIDEAVRGSNIGVWVNDMPDGDYRTGRITAWNMWEHLGYQPRAPADDASWGALMHPDDREPIAAAMQRYLSGETSVFEIPLRLRHADGSYRWFLVRGVVVRDGRGTPIRFAGTSVDITDRKRAEEALRTSEQRFRTFVEHATDARRLAAW
jgi:PAS domain S-box-containing protein